MYEQIEIFSGKKNFKLRHSRTVKKVTLVEAILLTTPARHKDEEYI